MNKAFRITTVLLAQGALIIGHFYGHSTWTFLAFAVFLIAFLILVRQNSKLIKQQRIKKAEDALKQRDDQRLKGLWVDFAKDGEEYVDLEHAYSHDLNLFGNASLFQYINECSTHYGKEILKFLLLTEKRDEATVLRRQAAVKEIAKNKDFCKKLKTIGLLSQNISFDPGLMIKFFEGTNRLIKSSFTRFSVRLLPILTGALLVLNIIIGLNNLLIILFGFSLIFQVMVFASLSNKTEAVLRELSKFKGSLDDFGTITTLIKDSNFSAELNTTWQSKLPAKWPLKRISIVLNARNITFLDLALNILFLCDIHLVCALEKLRTKEARNMRTWLETTGYFEAMVSVAVLPALNPNWVYPTINNEFEIDAKNLGHPLIEEPDRVINDFNLDGIAVISGSNMSGKTTLLRTIGINLVLCYIGSPVCATRFSAPIMKIFTCMRPPDNLKQNISTFYAELLRVKRIIDSIEPMLFLIDEIFAGTNSEDRVEGATHVLQNLQTKRNLGLITTHDLEVCKVPGFENYHFSEYYENNEIRFDFKLKAGMSTTRNAKHLMRMVGIDIC